MPSMMIASFQYESAVQKVSAAGSSSRPAASAYVAVISAAVGAPSTAEGGSSASGERAASGGHQIASHATSATGSPIVHISQSTIPATSPERVSSRLFGV